MIYQTRVSRIAALTVVIALLAGACQSGIPTTDADGAFPVPSPDEDATPPPPVASLEHWASFDTPVAIRAPDGDDAWYVVERMGRVWRYDGSDRELVIDVVDEVSIDFERGLFDFVVSPDGRHAYVHFTGTEEPYGHSKIWEYRWTGSGIAGEPREVLVVEQPYPHHNGGQLQFGPDGYLYIALGDGGTATLTQEPDNGDPHDHGQRTDVLLGKILRIGPRPGSGREYTIPEDNPFVGRSGRDEIWAYGLRNPWRFSFDRETGDLWIADVGHRYQEEINFQPAGDGGGQNYGWNRLEANLPYKGDPPPEHVLPVFTYPHVSGSCAIIGGYVYRGTNIPDLHGSYVFGDLCTGELHAIRLRRGTVMSHTSLGVAVDTLVALGEDRDGELFAVSLTEGVFRVTPVGT